MERGQRGRAHSVLLLFAFLGVSAGCQTKPTYVGTVVSGSATLNCRPKNLIHKGSELQLDRDPISNKLSVITVKNRNTARTSVASKEYTLFLKTSRSQKLPAGTPKLLLPFNKTRHIDALLALREEGNDNQVTISFECDRLGLDLVSSLLFAPGGFVIMLQFDDGSILPARLRADALGTTLATIFLKSGRV